ncbi:hypothetical protein ACFWXK_13400 [Streptomyces sp. NPDC059070]|uniref:hypothetical protein n=1 Tax=Streptomyces sp. NPDC059070 TaxID=3346713 RepID=UPI0036871D70
MARAGRPQGAPKGRSQAANDLARLLREVTGGLTVRELAQRYGGGKTVWGEYRSGARIIPLGRLHTVVKDRVRDARVQREVLDRARRLHALALTARAADAPAPAADDALRRAREDFAESGRLVEGLLTMMAMLQRQTDPVGSTAPHAGADVRGQGLAPADPDTRWDAPTAPEAVPGADDRAGGPAGPAPDLAGEQHRRSARDAADTGPGRPDLEEALDQLIAARATREDVRRAVADVRAWRESARRPRLPAPPPGEENPAATITDPALRLELARLHHLVELQREDAYWLWERTRADRAPADVVEGVVLQRLDRLPAVPDRLPARRRPRPALPAGSGPRPRHPAALPLALLAAVLALAVVMVAALVGVVVGRHQETTVHDVTAPREPLPGTTDRPGPSVSPSPSTSAPTASPSPSPSRARPGATPSPGGPGRPRPTAGPTGSVVLPPAPSAPAVEQSGGTAYAVSQDRRSILRWTGRDGSWKVIGPAADKIYAGAAGVFMTNPDDGRIFRFDEPSSTWSQIGSPGEQFITAGEGFYAITEDRHAVVRWNGVGAEWSVIGGGAARLYAGGAGLFATDPTTGVLNRYSGYGTIWFSAGGPGSDFAVGPDYVARLSPDGKEIWLGNGRGSNWQKIGGPAGRLYAGGAGLFAVDSSGRALKYEGVPGAWTPIGEAGVSLAVGAQSVYRIGSNGQDVSRWTGRASVWKAMGTSASALAATG